MPADARSRCGRACPTRPRAGTAAAASCVALPSRTAASHACRDLPEDLALADDHRVETGRDREEVRHRGVVVVRVEVVGEVVGIGTRVRGEELGDVADRGVEVRAARA